MPLVVVGSVALDRVETPTQQRNTVLGGSAVFFSYAASFFTSVRLAGVVGDDWPAEHAKLLESRHIDTAGLQIVPGGKTFRWRGRYLPNMNDRETLDLQLNVLEAVQPRAAAAVWPAASSSSWPTARRGLQMRVLDQCPGAVLTVADTMDYYINTERAGVDGRC